MPRTSRDRGRDHLTREIKSETYRELLDRLQTITQAFERFRDWPAVVSALGKATSHERDVVLRAIFQEHSTSLDPRWRAILLAIFWKRLETLHAQKRRWDPEPDELWQNLTWTFLQVICRIDIKRRPQRLTQKIVNDTIHRLHDEYRRIWRRANVEILVGYDDVGSSIGGTIGVDLAGIEHRQAQRAKLKRLRFHLDQGTISEADYFLLLGTRVYGRSSADYARQTGLDVELTRKRRQRAEAAIRRSEKKSQKVCPVAGGRGGLTPSEGTDTSRR